MAKKKDAIHFVKEKIEKCKIMVKSSENATNNKINNDKDGFNILKVRLIEYEKQRIEELNKFVFDLIEIKQKYERIISIFFQKHKYSNFFYFSETRICFKKVLAPHSRTLVKPYT